ncbi:hypothetical protein GQ607_010697 [Colletotrichum asianum]|uniref:Uncharacterized protein n=1 Tax=Colletotrichum asianum TaxID=702518 RepID=A0A8H3ZQ27_9PEZI|nr:hypothetical protein GQ607_010697 [Colletotrichum asianum]
MYLFFLPYFCSPSSFAAMLVKKAWRSPQYGGGCEKKEGLLQGARQPTNNREKRPTGPQQTKPAAREIHVSDDESTKKSYTPQASSGPSSRTTPTSTSHTQPPYLLLGL